MVRGLFIGDDVECFKLAAELSLKVNFEILDEPIRKAVVYLDPRSFTPPGSATRRSIAPAWRWPMARSWSSWRRRKEFGEDQTSTG